jgi:hypothetical protein
MAASVSSGGLVLGMQQTVVNPPATAAAAPVAMVSSSSLPGSRKWTWMSSRPGTISLLVASMVWSAELEDWPMAAILPSRRSRSAR